MPVIWKRRLDKGHIFYRSIGHRLDDLKVPEMTEIIKRGFAWATQKSDVLQTKYKIKKLPINS